MKKLLNNKLFLNAIILYFLILFLYTIFVITPLYENVYVFKIIVGILIFVILVYMTIYAKFMNIDGDIYPQLIKCVIVLGIIIRIAVMVVSDCRYYTQDMSYHVFDLSTGKFEFLFYEYGHGGYILSILDGHLPQSYSYQFYQQPLFYLLGSGSSYLVNLIIQHFKNEEFFYIDAAKIISCYAGCLAIGMVKRTFEKFELNEPATLISISFFCFYPGLIFLSSRVTPDALTMMFVLLSLIFTLEWLDNPNWKNTIILAAIYGFAVMTKISAAILAPVTIFIFVFALYKHKLTAKKLAVKLVLFSTISFPLGLWYNVRNYIKFGQPFGYIYPQEVTFENYTGDRNIFDRFINLEELFSDFVVDMNEDCNFFSFFFKTSLFGTVTFNSIFTTLLGMLVFIFSLFCVLMIIISIVTCFVDEKKNYVYEILAIYFLVAAAFFYLKTPFSCSMDFRYMAIIVVPASILIGKFYQRINRTLVKDLVEIVIVCQGIFSIAYYLVVPLM